MGGFPRSLQFSTSVSDLAEGRGSETKIFREESLRLARDPFKAYKQSKASQRLSQTRCEQEMSSNLKAKEMYGIPTGTEQEASHQSKHWAWTVGSPGPRRRNYIEEHQ